MASPSDPLRPRGLAFGGGSDLGAAGLGIWIVRRGSRGSESLVNPGPLGSSPPLKSLSCIALTELEAMKKKGCTGSRRRSSPLALYPVAATRNGLDLI